VLYFSDDVEWSIRGGTVPPRNEPPAGLQSHLGDAVGITQLSTNRPREKNRTQPNPIFLLIFVEFSAKSARNQEIGPSESTGLHQIHRNPVIFETMYNTHYTGLQDIGTN
jgi:hypothetical protein